MRAFFSTFLKPKAQKIPTTNAPLVPEPVVNQTTDAKNKAPKLTYTDALANLYNEDAYSIRTSCNAEPCSLLFKQRMNALLSSGDNHDVTLTFGEKAIPAHRKILAARSEYFKTMFEGKMAESHQQNINIEEEQECEPVRALLQYFYCDYIDLSKYNMLELLHVATKYAPENERLSQILVHNIFTTLLQESNITQVYTYAKENEISALINTCGRYIYLNSVPQEEFYKIRSEGTYNYLQERFNHNIYLIGTEKSMVFNYLKTQTVDIEANDASGTFSFISEIPTELIAYYTVSNADNTGTLKLKSRSRVKKLEDDSEPLPKKALFRGVNVICFNYNDEQSFLEAINHVESVSDRVTLLLVGMYSGTISQEKMEQAQQMATDYGCNLVDICVGDVMDKIIDCIMEASNRVEEHIKIQQRLMRHENMPTKK